MIRLTQHSGDFLFLPVERKKERQKFGIVYKVEVHQTCNILLKDNFSDNLCYTQGSSRKFLI